jgi:hypothetical protein
MHLKNSGFVPPMRETLRNQEVEKSQKRFDTRRVRLYEAEKSQRVRVASPMI